MRQSIVKWFLKEWTHHPCRYCRWSKQSLLRCSIVYLAFYRIFHILNCNFHQKQSISPLQRKLGLIRPLHPLPRFIFPTVMSERDKRSVRDGSTPGSKPAHDKHDPQPMIFEPEEFPEGEVPKPRELFVHGDYGDKVFFKDDRYPGKTFIYASTPSYDRRARRRRPAQKAEATGEAEAEIQGVSDSRQHTLEADTTKKVVTEVQDTSDPQQFPDGVVPIPSKLFVDGKLWDEVLFTDDRYPGKTFIYTSGFAH